ncbi:MAG: hypothetical protein TR69_WS6001000136 [candidate division WS6 bacterium OLB20]|uniref:Uncharacterized protein n=1 Tax=candidate division WS6 bacterium OLB20 TaxID=1617426 RepID=A0A136M047_9BACT|nr:MAG: hypothetical protein TR69_WS6001000136 [candidate division WS6 bacterium OLB20]
MTEAVIPETISIYERDYVRSVKDRYAGIAANAVNYVATLLEGYLISTPEAIAAARAEAHSNLFRAVREHHTASATGKDSYCLHWTDTPLGPALKSQFGLLDDLFAETDSSAQLEGFEFEQPRNTQNRLFYERLKRARAAGYNGPMAEFSPRPEMTQQAYARGYEGNDTILIYRSENGTEHVEQLWFKGAASYEAYRPLLQQLASDPVRSAVCEYSSEPDPLQNMPGILDDIAIMSTSGRVSEDFIDSLRQFASTQRLKTLPPEKVSLLQDFMLLDVQSQVYDSILPIAESEAARLSSSREGWIEIETLEEIAAAIMRQQFRIEQYIKALQGETCTLDSFDSLSRDDQDTMMRQANFVLKGCGFSYAANRQNGSNAGFSPGMEISLRPALMMKRNVPVAAGVSR